MCDTLRRALARLLLTSGVMLAMGAAPAQETVSEKTPTDASIAEDAGSERATPALKPVSRTQQADAVRRLAREPSDLPIGLPEAILADGTGLPPGQGKVVDGKVLYESLCIDCHGVAGVGGSALELVGDASLLDSDYPDRGIAVFWPYAPPLFDYVRRAMPPDAPWSLTADDTYSVVAYLLWINDLVSEEAVVDAEVLSVLRMPNRDGFRDASR